MSAINVLTFPSILVSPQTCCECVRDHADTHVPVTRAPVVSGRWTVETNGDGTRRLVERWSINQPKQEGTARSKPGGPGVGFVTASGDQAHVAAVAKGGRY
ncbi:MAG: hypothetical protein ABSD98_01540 [Candidatus Korobacteraceae bacterium]|jgi:hypothetical protein